MARRSTTRATARRTRRASRRRTGESHSNPREQASLADVKSLVIRAHRASFIVHALPHGYALLVRLVRGAGFRGWQRAVPACARRIGREAGWPDAAGAAWSTWTSRATLTAAHAPSCAPARASGSKSSAGTGATPPNPNRPGESGSLPAQRLHPRVNPEGFGTPTKRLQRCSGASRPKTFTGCAARLMSAAHPLTRWGLQKPERKSTSVIIPAPCDQRCWQTAQASTPLQALILSSFEHLLVSSS